MSTVTIKELTWDDCLPPAEWDLVAQLESILDVKLPADYLEVARVCQESCPRERRRFAYRTTASGTRWYSGLAYMLPLDPGHAEGIVQTMRGLAVDDQLPRGIVPIATDGGGDYVCLDYRLGTPPTIAYWSHERDKDDSTFPLAESFTAFLAALEPPRELPEGWDAQ